MLASPLPLVTTIVIVIFKHNMINMMKVVVQKLIEWMTSEDEERVEYFRLIQNDAKQCYITLDKNEEDESEKYFRLMLP